MKRGLFSHGPFPVEHHSPGAMINPHLVAFLKGLEDVVLSVGLGILNGDGAVQVDGLILPCG